MSAGALAGIGNTKRSLTARNSMDLTVGQVLTTASWSKLLFTFASEGGFTWSSREIDAGTLTESGMRRVLASANTVTSVGIFSRCLAFLAIW